MNYYKRTVEHKKKKKRKKLSTKCQMTQGFFFPVLFRFIVLLWITVQTNQNQTQTIPNQDKYFFFHLLIFYFTLGAFKNSFWSFPNHIQLALVLLSFSLLIFLVSVKIAYRQLKLIEINDEYVEKWVKIKHQKEAQRQKKTFCSLTLSNADLFSGRLISSFWKQSEIRKLPFFVVRFFSAISIC